ncbi:MAG: hypothetical protein QXT26_02550 [Thermoproteota archaeon]
MPKETQYEIWAKIYFGSKGSSLNFLLNNKKLCTINTRKAFDYGFKWTYIGTIILGKGNNYLDIESDRGENAIGNVVIAPLSVLDEASKKAREILQNKYVIVLSEIENVINEDCLNASNQWGINASEGIAAKLFYPSNITAPLFIPSAGRYEILLRTTNPETMDDWKIFGNGQISLTSLYVKNGKYSIIWSHLINKTDGVHSLMKEFADEDWSRYDYLAL